MSSGPDMSEYLEIFLQEAEEQVDTLDDGLLRLEKEPDNPELLQEIFRAAHSLKSSSAAMGLPAMSRLCHASENLLDRFRSGAIRPDTEMIDALLAAVDALKTMKETVRGGGRDDLEVTEVVAALEAAGSGAAAGESTAAGEVREGEAGVPGESPEGTEERAEEDVYQVSLRIAEDSEMRSVRAQIALTALEKIGRVLRTEPPREEIGAGHLGLDLQAVVAAEGGEETIRKALGSISEVERVRVGPDERVLDAGPAGRGRQPTELAAMARRGEQTVRVNVARLDNLMNLTGELVIDRTRLEQLGRDLEELYGSVDSVRDLRETCLHMARTVGSLQEEVMKARMLPVAQLFRRFPRMVRDLAHKMGKEVDLVSEGEDTELDRSVIEEMVDPLSHLLRNALDHGIEAPAQRRRVGKPAKGRLVLAARQEDNHIVIELTDDGAGIDVRRVRESAVEKGVVGEARAAAMSDDEAIQLVFAPGMSTSGSVSDVSGRGVGMDVVKSNVSRLHGTVEIRTKPKAGTTVAVKLPLTLAISQALLVKTGEEIIAVPLVYVVETTRVARDALQTMGGRLVTILRGRVLPLVDVREALGRADRGNGIERGRQVIRVVVARSNKREVGLVVDGLVREQEIVLKPMGAALGDVAGLSGATILGDGTVALVVDVASLMDRAGLKATSWSNGGEDERGEYQAL